MGKSFRKRPIIGNAADTDKWDKRKSNRNLRHKLKQRIHSINIDTLAHDEVLPEKREVSDTWVFNKDGKQYVDTEKHPELMRK